MFDKTILAPKIPDSRVLLEKRRITASCWLKFATLCTCSRFQNNRTNRNKSFNQDLFLLLCTIAIHQVNKLLIKRVVCLKKMDKIIYNIKSEKCTLSEPLA